MTHTSQIPSNAPVAAAIVWRPSDVTFARGTSLRAFETGRGEGDAPVLLLVHGMGHWTQAAWNRLVPQFIATHRIVAFDLPGFGASEKPDVSYTLDYFTSALRAVANAYDLRTFALAGHSLGGLIAANYAAFHPDRTRALALLDPAGFARTPMLVARIAGASLVRNIPLHIRPSRAFVRYQFRHAAYDPSTFGDAEYERAYELANDPATARSFLRVYAGAAYEMRHMRAFHARLARYEGPVTLLWGRHDRYIPARTLARARRVYPHADALLVERCGHCPHIEYPHVTAQRMRAIGI